MARPVWEAQAEGRRMAAREQAYLIAVRLKPLSLVQQVFDRGRVPTRSAARRAFVHGFKLGGNLLQCAVGRGSLDAGDKPDQPVITVLRSGAV